MKLPILSITGTLLVAGALSSAVPAADIPLFDKANITAWCIVPFDAKKRGPEERAQMLEQLGIKKFAYDWRAENVPTFDAEVAAMKRHGVEMTAWWFPGGLNAEARAILDCIKRNEIHPQLWVMMEGGPHLRLDQAFEKTPAEQAAHVQRMVAGVKPIAAEAAKLGCKVALYNHGGWFGIPENQLEIIKRLKQDGIENVGMVYTQHHGHGEIDRFDELFPKMKPYLLAVSLNGMIKDGDLSGSHDLGTAPLGQGDQDLRLLRIIKDSGWTGPVGIVGETSSVDVELRLRDHLDGLDWLVPQLGGQAPGPQPVPRSWKLPTTNHEPRTTNSTARTPGFITENKPEYRQFPITVECRATLNGSRGFNILVASDGKHSAEHWELYSHTGTGYLSVFLPGRGGDFSSRSNVVDGKIHGLAAILEPDRVRLYVDAKPVLDAPIRPLQGPVKKGRLAIAQLVDGTLGCDGVIEAVRLSRGVREPVGSAALAPDENTIGFWKFTPPPPVIEPAEFRFDNAPLRPDQWPNRNTAVNRDRVYDFYEKEARHFMALAQQPELLPEYPGIDGGKSGHWGNQNDNVWRDARWNDTDIGNLMCGVLHAGSLTIPKGVCVNLGGKENYSACFDPVSVDFTVEWRGGFVAFDPVRHGFMSGLKIKGERTGEARPARSNEPFIYHGFYRQGRDVVFSYDRGGKHFLTSKRLLPDGEVTEDTTLEEQHPLRAALQGGPAQWPQWIETQGSTGQGKPYALDTLTLPLENPWKTLFFVSGSDFFPNGDAAICTMTGEVWLCRGIDESLQHLRWKRFATGLHQPLGLKIVDGKICVTGRDQITRLHDLNGDDEADFYECLTNAQLTSPSGHDYITGCERDAEGRWYFASGNQGPCRVIPGGPLEVLATGFRNPNGLGLSRDGTVTTSAQEGDWTPASAICQITPGGYYGYGGPKNGQTVNPPLLYLPRGIDNSSGGQCFAESSQWGPLGGQLIHFSPGSANHFLILREKIGDQWQGAAVPLPGDFLSGAQQGRINPKDGQLYVTGMFGWGVYAPADGCFQRVRYTGGPACLPVKLETRANGVLITFSDPLDPGIAGKVGNHFAQCWNYRYSAAYGSPEYSLKHPDVPGHDPLAITSAHVLENGKKLFLEIPQLNPAHTVHLHVSTVPGQSREIFLTAQQLGEPFKDYPGYAVISKTPLPAVASTTAIVIPPPAKPNPWREGQAGRAIAIEAALGLQFAQKKITVTAGERLSLTFKNPDVVPHNWVLLQRGKLQAVGDLANKMITDPQGLARHYVPESPDVLAYSDMTNPDGSFTIHFNAPKEPGDYPYLCTFPGHWLVMNGVMTVK